MLKKQRKDVSEAVISFGMRRERASEMLPVNALMSVPLRLRLFARRCSYKKMPIGHRSELQCPDGKMATSRAQSNANGNFWRRTLVQSMDYPQSVSGGYLLRSRPVHNFSPSFLSLLFLSSFLCESISNSLFSFMCVHT